MTTITPQFITDTAGKKLVVISVEEFEMMVEELEGLEDIKLFDDAKRDESEGRILLDDYLKQRKIKNV